MDEVWLKRALNAASKGKGLTAPNPAVGSVIVRDGKLLAEGYHERYGQPHAEVNAFLAAQESVEGATLYVTLEPCCHWGKTPPCTDLIIEKKIARVVYGHHDPNPVVDGGGREKLRAAGVTCESKALLEIEKFYFSYDRWTKHKLPTVTAKLAITLDGKTAGAHNEKLAITSDEANRFVHEARRDTDAILTTWKTVLHDNPKLNSRLDGVTVGKRVYVLDSRLRTPDEAVITHTASSLRLLASEKNAPRNLVDKWRARGVEVTLFPGEQIAWPDLWKKVGEDGVHDLWIEAGGSTFERLVKEKQLQRALIFVAPFWLGETGLSAFTGAYPALTEGAQHFEWNTQGRDVCLEILW